MTTPERIRRRQHRLGYVIIAMGIAMIGQAYYFNDKDADNDACLIENFSQLTEALEVRSELATREALLNRRGLAASGYESAAADQIWQTFGEAAGYLREDPTKPLPPKEAERLNRQLVRDLLHYVAVAERVAERRDRLQVQRDNLVERRDDNPIPPFPSGTCEV
jgi:hypothetical protein